MDRGACHQAVVILIHAKGNLELACQRIDPPKAGIVAGRVVFAQGYPGQQTV